MRSMSATLLAMALRYAELGYPVFACAQWLPNNPWLTSFQRYFPGSKIRRLFPKNSDQGHLVTHRTITINRAPVLTLWAAVVAERL